MILLETPQPLPTKAAGAAPDVINAIRTASQRTGVDFSYLVEKAAAESSFNPNATASTSSATGLYQFIEQTWLGTVKAHGADHGMADAAANIERTSTGRFVVRDPDARQAILDMRRDAKAAALMAGEFAADNKAHLESRLGGEVGSTELYFAHFMGAGGATKFLTALRQNPDQIAADIFPREAAANRGVFFDRATGAKRSLQEVYDFFDKKFESEPGAGGLPQPVPVEPSDIASARPAKTRSPLALAGPLGAPLAGQPLSLFTVLVLNGLGTPGGDNTAEGGEDRRQVKAEVPMARPRLDPAGQRPTSLVDV